MNRYFEVMYLADDETKCLFSNAPENNELAGHIEAAMQFFGDYDIRKFRMREYSTKKEYENAKSKRQIKFFVDTYAKSYYTAYDKKGV